MATSREEYVKKFQAMQLQQRAAAQAKASLPTTPAITGQNPQTLAPTVDPRFAGIKAFYDSVNRYKQQTAQPAIATSVERPQRNPLSTPNALTEQQPLRQPVQNLPTSSIESVNDRNIQMLANRQPEIQTSVSGSTPQRIIQPQVDTRTPWEEQMGRSPETYQEEIASTASIPTEIRAPQKQSLLRKAGDIVDKTAEAVIEFPLNIALKIFGADDRNMKDWEQGKSNWINSVAKEQNITTADAKKLWDENKKINPEQFSSPIEKFKSVATQTALSASIPFIPVSSVPQFVGSVSGIAGFTALNEVSKFLASLATENDYKIFDNKSLGEIINESGSEKDQLKIDLVASLVETLIGIKTGSLVEKYLGKIGAQKLKLEYSTKMLNDLGLKPGASKSQVKEAYFKLQSRSHPDKHANESPEMQAYWQEVSAKLNNAYEWLIKKKNYSPKIDTTKTPEKNLDFRTERPGALDVEVSESGFPVKQIENNTRTQLQLPSSSGITVVPPVNTPQVGFQMLDTAQTKVLNNLKKKLEQKKAEKTALLKSGKGTRETVGQLQEINSNLSQIESKIAAQETKAIKASGPIVNRQVQETPTAQLITRNEAVVPPTPRTDPVRTTIPEQTTQQLPVRQPQPETNIYLRMPPKRVQEDAAKGVALAKQALKEIEASKLKEPQRVIEQPAKEVATERPIEPKTIKIVKGEKVPTDYIEAMRYWGKLSQSKDNAISANARAEMQTLLAQEKARVAAETGKSNAVVAAQESLGVPVYKDGKIVRYIKEDAEPIVDNKYIFKESKEDEFGNSTVVIERKIDNEEKLLKQLGKDFKSGKDLYYFEDKMRTAEDSGDMDNANAIKNFIDEKFADNNNIVLEARLVPPRILKQLFTDLPVYLDRMFGKTLDFFGNTVLGQKRMNALKNLDLLMSDVSIKLKNKETGDVDRILYPFEYFFGLGQKKTWLPYHKMYNALEAQAKQETMELADLFKDFNLKQQKEIVSRIESKAYGTDELGVAARRIEDILMSFGQRLSAESGGRMLSPETLAYYADRYFPKWANNKNADKFFKLRNPHRMSKDTTRLRKDAFGVVYRGEKNKKIIKKFDTEKERNDFANRLKLQGIKITKTFNPITEEEARKFGGYKDPYAALMRAAKSETHNIVLLKWFKALSRDPELFSESANPKAGFLNQIPDDPMYGEIAGKYYNQKFASYIDNRVAGRQDEGALTRTLRQVTGWFKGAKTVWEPGTVSANAVSNVILTSMNGVPTPIEMPGYWLKNLFDSLPALIDPRKGRGAYKVLLDEGVTGKSFAVQEIGSALSGKEEVSFAEIIRRLKNKFGDEDGNSFLDLTKAIAEEVLPVLKASGRKVSDFYGFFEDYSKAVIYDYARKEGIAGKKLNHEEAIDLAQKAVFDYSMVPQFINDVRNQPLYGGFVTFAYKIAEQIPEMVFKKPFSTMKWILLFKLAQQMFFNQEGLDGKDVDKLKPEGTNDFVIPFNIKRDENGVPTEMDFYDLSRYYPLGQITNLGGGKDNWKDFIPQPKLGSPIPEEGGGNQGLLSVATPPVLMNTAQAATNKNTYTGQPITEKTGAAGLYDRSSFLFTSMMPSWVPGLPGEKGGALYERYKNAGLLGGGPNVDTFGNLGSKTEAILRTFGTKTVKVNPAETIKYDILDLKTQTENNKSSAKKLMVENENLKRVSDPALSLQDKIRKMNSNQKEINSLVDKNEKLKIKAEDKKAWYEDFVDRMKKAAKDLGIIKGASAAPLDEGDNTKYTWYDNVTGKRGTGKPPTSEELYAMRGQENKNHLPINMDKAKPAILTVYNPKKGQTDSTPDIGALNRKMEFGDVAVGNRDELESAKKAKSNGNDTFVFIPELSSIKTPYGEGVFRVNDTMNKRYDGDNRLDVFIPNEMIGTNTEKIVRRTPRASYAYTK